MPFVSIADIICPQTQKNEKFWVWREVCVIYAQTTIYLLRKIQIYFLHHAVWHFIQADVAKTMQTGPING